MSIERCITISQNSEGIKLYRCVCGEVSTVPRGVGIGRFTIAGIPAVKTSVRHECPCNPILLLNLRVILIFEPLNGFRSGSAIKFEGDAIGDYGNTLLSLLPKRLGNVHVKKVAFSSLADLKVQIQGLATKYAFFETYFIFSGHGLQTGGWFVIDSNAVELASPRQLLNVINDFYKPPACLKHARVRLVNFSFCFSADTLRSVKEWFDGVSNLPMWSHCALVLSEAELTANTIELFDAAWLIQTVQSERSAEFVEHFINTFNNVPLSPLRHVIASKGNIVMPIADDDAMAFPAFVSFNGGPIPDEIRLSKAINASDGLVSH